MNVRQIIKQCTARSGGSSFVVGVLIALILINVIATKHFIRADLTSEGQYKLSDTSKQIIRQLDDLLTVKVYFSSKLPPDLASVSQYVRDILSEYQLYSDKVQVRFFDPSSKPELEGEAQSLGIPQVQMNILQKDKFEVQNGYLGLAILYQGKKELLPFIENTDNLEYQITTAIKKVSATDEKRIAFLTGNQEPGIYESPFEDQPTGESYIEARKALERVYAVNSLTLKNGIEITGFDTLVVAGAKEELNDREIFEIDQYIMRGGNVIFLIDSIKTTLGLQAVTNNTGLEKLIENLGVRLNPDVVLDVSNETVSFSSGVYNFVVNYPFWVKTLKDNYNIEVPVLSKIESTVFPWVGSLDTVSKDGILSTVLMTSTSQSWKMVSPFDLSPQQEFVPTKQGQYPLAIDVRGKFMSLFPGQKPPDVPLQEGENVAPVLSADQSRVGIAQSEKESRVIVIADSEFLLDRFIGRFPSNLNFFLNLVDSITLDDSLINIRAKTISDRPIREVSDKERNSIKILNIVVIPIVVVGVGLARTMLRRKKRESDSLL